jgi:hypothetical protein
MFTIIRLFLLTFELYWAYLERKSNNTRCPNESGAFTPMPPEPDEISKEVHSWQ